VGATLYGRLSTLILGVWVPTDFVFKVGANGSPDSSIVEAALWATNFVREMANDLNVPRAGTPLADLLAAEGNATAFCTDYAAMLLSALGEINIQQPARSLNACLKPNSYDCHTLVEFREPRGDVWMLLDPTFDLTARQSSDGQWATAADVSQATRRMNFSDVTFQFLGRGDSIARNYYIDYPLLFLNVYSGGAEMEAAEAASSLPFMEPVPIPVIAQSVYALQGTAGGSVRAMVDGVDVALPCDVVDGLTYIFAAGLISRSEGPAPTLYRPRRFVF
jgi:hypothetical protein